MRSTLLDSQRELAALQDARASRPWAGAPHDVMLTHPEALAAILEEFALDADPFDRLLVAQAQLENVPLLTADAWFDRYDVEVIPA